MTNVYPYIDSVTNSIASTLEAFRPYFDYYMGVHQFNYVGNVALPHSVPIFWNSGLLNYPSFTFPWWHSIVTNLRVPIQYLTS